MGTLRRLTGIAALQIYAIGLALLQHAAGVRTDEAKYLLDIPYPHPPFIRFLLGLTDGWAYQELFWRVIFATLLVQCVWFLIDAARPLGRERQGIIAVSWLLSGGVILQAGSIMLSAIVGVSAVILLWLLHRPSAVRAAPGLSALFWLASVFSALQMLLFAPLMWSAFRGAGVSRRQSLVFVGVPVLLLVLYCFTNPLVLATVAIHGTDGAHTTLVAHLARTITLWLVGGSGVLSVLGLIGIVLSWQAGLLLSFLLVTAYIVVSVPHLYYAILFTPLLVEGLFRLPRSFRLSPLLLVLLSLLGVWTLVLPHLPRPDTHPEQVVMDALHAEGITGTVMINGSFGHQWQYASPFSVRRYRPELSSQAQAIICVETCGSPPDSPEWHQLPALPVQTWVRSR